MSKYYRVWNGKTNNSWMVDESEIPKLKGRESHFVSVCYYSEQQYKDFKKTNSVAGVRDTKTNKLWFDFDSHDNLEAVRQDVLTLTGKLAEVGFKEENVEYYFSGAKGFHVIVRLNNELTSTHVKKIVSRLGQGLQTLDLQVYDANRILRALNTKHEKTGLFKVPLSLDEIEHKSIDEIKTIAAAPRLVNFFGKPVDLPSQLPVEEEKKVEPIKVLEPNTEDPLHINEIDFKNRPAGWKEYKWSIAQGRFEKGTRNHSMMVIASTCRALKYGRDHTEAICEVADRLHCEITGNSPMIDGDLEHQVLDVVFSTTWNGGQYSVENDLKLKQYCEKFGFKQEKEMAAEVVGLSDINSSFKHFVKNIDKNTIKTGIKRLDDALPITIGNNVGLIGAASSGKTSILLEILKNTSMTGVPSVVASLDMHRNRLYEKVLYKVSHDVYGKAISRDELYKKFQEDKDGKLVDEVAAQFGNVYFYDRSRPTVDDLRQFILRVEEQTGQKIKLLMIDYFERIGSDVTDATASSLKIANELQDLMNDMNIAVVTLVQPNKFSLAGGPDTPILNYTSIKGSSFLYQSFRSIISIWRPLFTPKTKHLDKYLEMAILKNDLGELDHFKFNWDGKTGTITDMTEEQEGSYESAIQEKREILKPESPEEREFSRFRKGQ